MSEQKNRGYNNIGFISITPERSIFLFLVPYKCRSHTQKRTRLSVSVRFLECFFLQRAIAISPVKILIYGDTLDLQRHLLAFWILKLQKDRKWRDFSVLRPWFQDLYLSTDFSLVTETQGTHCLHLSNGSWVVHSFLCCFMWYGRSCCTDQC